LRQQQRTGQKAAQPAVPNKLNSSPQHIGSLAGASGRSAVPQSDSQQEVLAGASALRRPLE
jgi:hypothetical protein